MITPRSTRLLRVADLRGFREALVSLACGGTPHDSRDRLILVPTRAAAAHLVRAIENRLPDGGIAVLPEFATRDELYGLLAQRLPEPVPMFSAAEREVLLGVACRAAVATGEKPPFRVRPGLVAEILRFYDSLRRHGRHVDAFERLALGALEPGALDDRGAERLVRQTRFLVAAFRYFESSCLQADAGDEHTLRAALERTAAAAPWRHVVVAVGDRALDPHGLYSADWNLLSRLPGLAQLDVVVTDFVLAGAFHERIHQLLPGIEEIRFDAGRPASAPRLLVPGGATVLHAARDREEEVAGFARWVRDVAREGEGPPLDRIALVVQRPLPYVYLGRDVLHSAGVPCQTFDALPLAAEPFAATLDLVSSAVAANFARGPAIALLRSPHFDFGPAASAAEDIAALDRALAEREYLGDLDVLRAIPVQAARSLERVIADLLPLRSADCAATHLSLVIGFVERYCRRVDARPEDERHARARGAVMGILLALRQAYARFDTEPVEFEVVAAMIRRWIEAHTFAPRQGDAGVHLIDAASAGFGDFELVQLAGLVDGEWPPPPPRSVFYASGLLRDLGWPADADRREGARAAFRNLLRLPSDRLVVSTFLLEHDALVSPSTLSEELESSGLMTAEYAHSAVRIFREEALALDPAVPAVTTGDGVEWAEIRLDPVRAKTDRYRGATSRQPMPVVSISGLERYQDCPFRFFAADVLELDEPPEEEASFSPRARGQFVHEVFHRFFREWDAAGEPAITADRLDTARTIFVRVADEMLQQLPATRAALERTRLFGSAISVGIIDVVLGLEASRAAAVVDRWLEYRLEGEFALGAEDGRRVALRGVADRIDLLEGRRLRVIDYKSGYPPDVRRALQVPIYAACAQERLAARDGEPWAVEEAAYLAFSGKRPLVPVVQADVPESTAAIGAARARVFVAADGIARGDFPPRPHDPILCTYCAFSTVCRKDYVGDA